VLFRSIGTTSLAVTRPDIAAGTEVKLYLRPEEIALNAAGSVNGNTLGAKITKVEFLGAFCLVGLSLDAAGLPALVANVPRQVVDGGGMAAGQSVTVSLPPDAMRVLG
jgi:iron(III) transport system ATP-binding protein